MGHNRWSLCSCSSVARNDRRRFEKLDLAGRFALVSYPSSSFSSRPPSPDGVSACGGCCDGGGAVLRLVRLAWGPWSETTAKQQRRATNDGCRSSPTLRSEDQSVGS